MIKWLMVAVISVWSLSAQAEEMLKLFKSGYQIVYTDYLDFDGCEWEKVYKIGPYYFECTDYEYFYVYGEADIMSDGSSSVHLCFEDGQCVEGRIFRR